jgi:hypothetical protein
VQAKELSLLHFNDCLLILKAFVNSLGANTPATELTSERIFRCRSALMKKHAPNTVNRHLGAIKAMFNYGLDFNILDRLPNLRKALTKLRRLADGTVAETGRTVSASDPGDG